MSANTFANKAKKAILNKLKSINKKTILNYILSLKPSSIGWICLIWIIIPFAYISFNCYLGESMRKTYPQVKSSVVENYEFSEERTRDYIKEFEKIGNKPMFSLNNELTKQYLIDNITSIKETYNVNNLTITVDLQPFPEDFNYGLPINFFTTKPPENVLVLVKPNPSVVENDNSDNIFMLSSHYDTQGKSPGSSDDISNVSLMLELLRNLLTSKKKLLHSVLFAWVNSDEIGLFGATVFGNHSWKDSVKRFVNLESMASGGKSLLFRTYPSSVSQEIKSVSKIKANSIGEDLLSLTNSQTDFSVYTEDLNLPGFDFGYYENGYYYHSKKDTLDKIDEGSIQLLGEILHQFLDVYVFSENSPLNHPTDVLNDKITVYYFSSFYNWGYYYFSEVLMIIFSLLMLFVALSVSITSIFLKYYIYVDDKKGKKDEKETNKQEKMSKQEEIATKDLIKPEDDEENVRDLLFCKFFWKNFLVMLIYLLFYFLSFGSGIIFAILSSLISSIINPMAFFRNYLFTLITYGLSTVTGMVLFQYFAYLCLRLIFKEKYEPHQFTNERWTSFNLFLNLVAFFLSVLGPITRIRARLSFMLFYIIFSNVFLIVIIIIQSIASFLFKNLPEKYLNQKILIDSINNKKKLLIEKKKDQLNLTVSGEFDGIYKGKKVKIVLNKDGISVNEKDSTLMTLKFKHLSELKRSVDEQNNVFYDVVFFLVRGEKETEKFRVSIIKNNEEFEKVLSRGIESVADNEEVDEIRRSLAQMKAQQRSQKIYLQLKTIIYTYKPIYLLFIWSIFFIQSLSYETMIDILLCFNPMAGRGDKLAVPSVLHGCIIAFFFIFLFFILLPTLHRAANFLKLFLMLLFLSFLFTVILGAIFPYTTSSPKWIKVENYYNSSDSINLSNYDIQTETTIISSFGKAWCNISAFDVDKLKSDGPIFDYYRKTTTKIPVCNPNECILDIEEETIPRINSYRLMKLNNSVISLDINYNTSYFSILKVYGDDFDETNDIKWENRENIKYRNGSFYQTNVLSSGWSGNFTVRDTLYFEISLIYNKMNEIKFLEEMFEGDNWFVVAGKDFTYFRGILWILEEIRLKIDL